MAGRGDHGLAVVTGSLTLRRRHRWWRPEGLVGYVVLVLLAFLVLVPVYFVVVKSLQIEAAPGETISLAPWRTALGDSRLLGALGNTLMLMVAFQVPAMVIGVFFAWLIARTDLPLARTLEFVFWIAVFLPVLPVAQGWSLLLDPNSGLLNTALQALPFVDSAPLNIYSFWGIVWMHLMTGAIAFKVFLLVPAFRNIDGSLGSASLMAGAGRVRTFLRIELPLALPSVLVALGLSVLFAFRSFELEAYLGTPFRFDTFATLIYRYVRGDPPMLAQATVLATLVLGILLPFVVLQRWLLSRQAVESLSGTFQHEKIRLGRWRIPLFLLVLTVGLLTTVVPLVMLGMGTFMKLFGFFDVTPSPWTMDRWATVLHDPLFLSALKNSVVIGIAAAALGVIVSAFVAYFMARIRFSGSWSLDLVSWIPATLPGVILSLGILWMFLAIPPLRTLYGGSVILVLALFVVGLTFGVQIIRGYIVQVGAELEESGRVSGGSRMMGLRRIVAPLVMPGLLVAFILLFNGAVTNVATVSLVSTNATQPLALLQLNYLQQNRYESAAAAGMVVALLAIGAAGLVRWLGRKFEL